MLNNINYSEKLRHPKWQKKRLEILQRDNFICTKCGDNETELHIHHLKYNGEPYDVPNENLITVCKYCHIILEEFKANPKIIKSIRNVDSYKLAIGDEKILIYHINKENGIIIHGSLINRDSELLKVLSKLYKK